MRSNSLILPALCVTGATVWFLVCGARADDAAAPPVPALPWLHEGLQLTYSGGSSRTPAGGATEGDRGAAGMGYQTLTIVRIDGEKIIVSGRNFNTVEQGSPPIPGPVTGYVWSVDQSEDTWIDPAKLAEMHETQRLKVTKLQWKMGDDSVDAIRLDTIKNGMAINRIYGLTTGLLLHLGSHNEAAEGDMKLATGDFISMRDLKVPWAAEPRPEALRSGHSLHFQGQVTTELPGALPPPPVEFSTVFKVTADGDGWLQAEQTDTLSAPAGAPAVPAVANEVSGSSQFLGIWAGPKALAELKVGQQLDEDPVLKTKTIVSDVNPDTVSITESSSSAEIEFRYDLGTGICTATRLLNKLLHSQSTMQLGQAPAPASP